MSNGNDDRKDLLNGLTDNALMTEFGINRYQIDWYLSLDVVQRNAFLAGLRKERMANQVAGFFSPDYNSKESQSRPDEGDLLTYAVEYQDDIFFTFSVIINDMTVAKVIEFMSQLVAWDEWDNYERDTFISDA